MNRTSNSVSAIDLVTYQHVADIPLEKYDGTGRVINLVLLGYGSFLDEKILLIPWYGQR